jgi:hypothetical protein
MLRLIALTVLLAGCADCTISGRRPLTRRSASLAQHASTAVASSDMLPYPAPGTFLQLFNGKYLHVSAFDGATGKIYDTQLGSNRSFGGMIVSPSERIIAFAHSVTGPNYTNFNYTVAFYEYAPRTKPWESRRFPSCILDSSFPEPSSASPFILGGQPYIMTSISIYRLVGTSHNGSCTLEQTSVNSVNLGAIAYRDGYTLAVLDGATIYEYSVNASDLNLTLTTHDVGPQNLTDGVWQGLGFDRSTGAYYVASTTFGYAYSFYEAIPTSTATNSTTYNWTALSTSFAPNSGNVVNIVPFDEPKYQGPLIVTVDSFSTVTITNSRTNLLWYGIHLESQSDEPNGGVFDGYTYDPQCN